MTKHVNVLLAQDIDLTTCTQLELEIMYSKYQLIPVLSDEFRQAGIEDTCESLELDVKFTTAALVQMHLFKRCKPAVLIGVLLSYFEKEQDPAQACADAIEELCHKDLIDCVRTENGFVLIAKFVITGDVLDRLDKFQYPLPMVEEPQKVSNNRSTGYQTIKGSLILKKNHHDEDICLDHINRMNAIPLSLNEDVVAFIQNQWRNLDKQKPTETVDEFKQRQKAFAKYDTASRDILQGLIVHGNRFWLTHKYDKRGRTYCQGYHVTYQGNDWNKACIQLADAEPLNKE